MAIIYKKFRSQIIYLFPIILLYFLSITEIDTQFSNHFEILSFNLQLIIVYFWTLKNMNVLGNGHVFFAGINNAKFRVPVLPGDQLLLETTLINQRRNFWVFDGKASVDGKLVAQAEINLMLQPI